jgi:single-stranded DNA-binding protein
MNSVHLIGRLATDVEVKEVNGGSKVSSFILAVDRNAEEAEVGLLRHRVVRCSAPCRSRGELLRHAVSSPVARLRIR